MKHTYQKPSIQVVRINSDQIMGVATYSGYNVNPKDLKEYDGPVIEKMDPSSGGPTASWNEKIWGQAD